MVRLFQDDFSAFTANGFAPVPLAGQLDSGQWRVLGLSDAPNPAYGFTGPAGGDFGRGTIGTNDPATAGVYAPLVDGAIVLQPTGAELDLDGAIELQVRNTSGAAAAAVSVAFDWVARNSGGRADAISLSYSLDDVTFTTVSGVNFTSPAAAAAGAGFEKTAAGPVTIGGLALAPGASFYLRWTHTSSTGSGNRDEIGIDDVTVDTTTGTGGGTPGGGTPPVLTAISAIQGSGDTSPLAGAAVTTTGIVTAISLGSSKGYYLQDPAGDGDAGTSDGIFVFTGAIPAVAVGDRVQVSGTVQEFRPSGAAPGALSLTELSSITATSVLSSGNALPAAALIGPGGIVLPGSDFAAGNAAFERLEGMLVTVKDPLVVGPTSSFGEIFTVAGGGAGATGLNARGDLLVAGGAASFGNTDIAGGDFNPERIQIDPGLGITNPGVSTGARLGDVTGVVGYDFGNYQVLATTAPIVVQASPLTKAAATLSGDADHLLVASYNAENLDPGDGAARFATIASEIVGKVNTPDIVALQEVQDNNGATDNGVISAAITLQLIADAILATGGPRYAVIDNPFIGNDTNGGEPGGNIRTAFLYRPDRVGFVDGSLSTIAADGAPISSGTYADQQTNPDNPFYASRPPLSARFTFNGQEVTVLSDHFTSKGGSGVLYGDQTPPLDAGEVQRAAQAQAVNAYVDRLLAADPQARVIVTGDLNDFGFEQPLSVLKGTASIAGYDVPGTNTIGATATYTPGGTPVLADLQDTLPPEQRFDYVFEGNAETLDHMLVTAALAAGAQFQPVHINSEFFDQTSDHDPLVGRFAIPRATTAAAAKPSILLTNDDGYNAPGIQTLYAALVSAGYDVHIVAPATNQSAQGSSLGGTGAVASPVAITQFAPGNYYVDGRPAVASLAGLDDLFAAGRPDLVISGTNRGENVGTSANISGTVGAALQALYEGVPSIAVSAGSFGGSYDAAFANAANFVVDYLAQLAAARQPGALLLPGGASLSINVPGNPALAGAAVTQVTAESTSVFPYAAASDGTFAEGFVVNTSPSGSPTSEGSQFLTNHVTISPLDGNWGADEASRAALAVRLGGAASVAAPAGRTLKVLLLNEDGLDSPGLVAMRQALLAKGYDVKVLTPATDQSATGSALTLTPLTVTRYDASTYSANGTPASLVSLALDPSGLFAGARPDLVVLGADRGDAVGIENANHSATLGGVITALFNYGVPSIAVSAGTGTAADLQTSAAFVANLVANLRATQGSDPQLLPQGIGLSVNVPAGASAANYAFTTIDAGTDADLSAVAGNPAGTSLVYTGPVESGAANSEGDAFNAGKITVSPIDGSLASRDPAAYTALATSLGTTYGVPTAAPATLSFTVSEDAYQGDARFAVSVNGHRIGGVQTATAAAGQSQVVTLLDFFDPEIDSVGITFVNDAYDGGPGLDRNLYVDKLVLNGATYEGETAFNGAGTGRVGVAILEREGTLNFGTSAKIVLRVSEDAYKGDAQFITRVNGQQVGGTRTATAAHADGQYQDVTLTGNFGDIYSVAIEFLNDAWDGTPSTDRNLYVDQIRVNDVLYGGEYASNAAGDPAPGEASLLRNGALTFLTQGTLVLTVSEDAFQGDAQFVARVNGRQIGGVQTASASHAAGATQDVVLQGLFGNVNNIALDFVNDSYGGSAMADRNLYIERLTLDGQAIRLDAGSNTAGGFAGGQAVLLREGTLALQDLLLPGR